MLKYHFRITRKDLLIVGIVLSIFFLAKSGTTQTSPVKLVCDIWPPYQQFATGTQVTGFSVEVVGAVLKRMDVETQIIGAYPWKRAISTLEVGNADALCSANFTPAREIFARYPDEALIESPWLIWTRGGDVINSIGDLKGKRIGVVLGYSYTEAFWTYIETYCHVERVFKDEINFKKLVGGRLDAVVAEYGNGHHIVESLGLSNIHPNWEYEVKRDGLYIIFNRKNCDEDFVKSFSDELKRFKATTNYQDIEIKYFGINR
jgi:polar amino acid transport system substrate-binding protein